jgi:hypothetical protein
MSQPISLTKKRLRRMQTLTTKDLEREIELVSEEMKVRSEDDEEDFDEYARDMLRRYQELFAMRHTDMGEFAARFFGLLETAYLDKDESAKAELNDFFAEE